MSKPDAYSAVAIGTGGSVGGRSVPFNFRITDYTSDDEVLQLADLLKEEGQAAVRSALEKEDRGRINPVGTTGNQIAVARKRQESPNMIITIVRARLCRSRNSIAMAAPPIIHSHSCNSD